MTVYGTSHQLHNLSQLILHSQYQLISYSLSIHKLHSLRLLTQLYVHFFSLVQEYTVSKAFELKLVNCHSALCIFTCLKTPNTFKVFSGVINILLASFAKAPTAIFLSMLLVNDCCS